MSENLPVKQQHSLLLDGKQFEHAQRVSKMLAESTMVPKHFQGNIGNCVIALNFAARMGLDPFMAMQKMYVIQGKPAIETQLAIALVNNTGKFTTIKYEFSDDGNACTAFAKSKETGEECQQTVTMEMAKAEGWLSKPGSKWKTMPQLMLQYRSAMFFARVYCPEALLGLYTKEEVQEMVLLEPDENGTYSAADRIKNKLDTIEPTPADEKVFDQAETAIKNGDDPFDVEA